MLPEREPEPAPGEPAHPEPRRAWLLPAAAALAAAAVGLTLLSVGGAYAGRLIFAAVATSVAVAAWPLLRPLERRLPRALLEVVPPLLLVALVASRHPYLLQLGVPVSHDHPLHVFKAWATWQQLANLQLTGWSDALDSGLPLGVLYPPGAAYLACAVRALTLGLLSWDRCHLVVLAISLLATPLGLYAFARRELGRVAALIAGALAAVQVGGWYQGGESFAIGWGVFAPELAVGLAFGSLAALQHAGRLPLTLGVLLAGAAIVVHPLALPVLAIVGLALAVQRAAVPAPGEERARPALRLLLGLGLGVALASFWLIPFVAHAGHTTPLAAQWLPLDRLATGLLAGGALDSVPALLSGLGVLGLLAAAIAGRGLAVASAAALGLTLLFASDEAVGSLGLSRLLPSLESLQFERFAYLVRPLLWTGLAAGFTLLRLSPAVSTRAGAGLLAGLLVAPVAVTFRGTGGAPLVLPPPQVTLAATDPVQRDIDGAVRLLAERGATGRVLLVAATLHDHRLAALAVPLGLPVARLSYPAAELFRGLGTRLDPDVLALQGVRWVVSRKPLDRPFLSPAGTSGGLYLYESEQPVGRALLGGGGQATVEHFRAGDVRVRLSGAGEGAALTVGVAPFPGWRAEQDGEELPLSTDRRGGLAFLRVPARDGVVHLRFVPGAPYRVGLALSLLAIALLALAWRRPELVDRALQPAWLPPVVLGLAALAAAGLAIRAHVPRGFDLRDELESLRVESPGRTCRRMSGSWGFRCNGQPAVRRAILTHRLEARRCLLVDASRGLVLTASDVDLVGTVVAEVSVADRGKGQAQLTVEAGDRSARTSVSGVVGAEVRLDVSGLGRGDLRFRLEGDAAPLCLEAHIDGHRSGRSP